MQNTNAPQKNYLYTMKNFLRRSFLCWYNCTELVK